jgi:hypothetical protein
MRTQAEVSEAIKILDQHPGLKAIITPGVDVASVLSGVHIKSLSPEDLKALCFLPLDIVITAPVRESFIYKAWLAGVKVTIDKQTGRIKHKAKTI